jgi:hypothetical protein
LEVTIASYGNIRSRALHTPFVVVVLALDVAYYALGAPRLYIILRSQSLFLLFSILGVLLSACLGDEPIVSE